MGNPTQYNPKAIKGDSQALISFASKITARMRQAEKMRRERMLKSQIPFCGIKHSLQGCDWAKNCYTHYHRSPPSNAALYYWVEGREGLYIPKYMYPMMDVSQLILANEVVEKINNPLIPRRGASSIDTQVGASGEKYTLLSHELVPCNDQDYENLMLFLGLMHQFTYEIPF